MPALGWIDWTLAGVLALSTVVGIWRGFVFEVMSLAGWLVAWIVAQAFAAEVGAHLPVGDRGSAANLAAAFVLTFVAALVLWALVARLVRMLVHATPLTVPDRALGAGFGLLRGVVLLLVVATLVALTPLQGSQGWRQSVGARWLAITLQGLKPVLPGEVARLLPA